MGFRMEKINAMRRFWWTNKYEIEISSEEQIRNVDVDVNVIISFFFCTFPIFWLFSPKNTLIPHSKALTPWGSQKFSNSAPYISELNEKWLFGLFWVDYLLHLQVNDSEIYLAFFPVSILKCIAQTPRRCEWWLKNYQKHLDVGTANGPNVHFILIIWCR